MAKAPAAPLPFFDLSLCVWYTAEQLKEAKINDPFYFRASSVSKLMAYPEKVELPSGALTEIEKIAARIVFGTKPNLSNFYLEKGLLMEDEAIDMYCEHTGTFAVKNKTRMYLWHPLHGVLLTGECDLEDDFNHGTETIDIKVAYSTETFPMFLKLGDRKGYEWQLTSYNVLFKTQRSKLAYCLPSTPEELIKRGEPLSWHQVNHIPLKHRIAIIEFDRDSSMVNQLMNRLVNAKAELKRLVALKGYSIESEIEYIEADEE